MAMIISIIAETPLRFIYQILSQNAANRPHRPKKRIRMATYTRSLISELPPPSFLQIPGSLFTFFTLL